MHQKLRLVKRPFRTRSRQCVKIALCQKVCYSSKKKKKPNHYPPAISIINFEFLIHNCKNLIQISGLWFDQAWIRHILFEQHWVFWQKVTFKYCHQFVFVLIWSFIWFQSIVTLHCNALFVALLFLNKVR